MSEVALTADRQTLPAGWRWARLGEVAVLNPRRPTLRRANSALTTFLPMSAVGVNGQGIEASEARPYGDVAKGYSYFAEGDVLFAKITPCMQNGKHTIARGLRDGIGFGSTEFHVVRPATDITPEWILNFLRQPRVLKDATAHFTGAVGQQRVPAAYLANLNLPLPPLPEQHRIVARLTEQLAEVERAHAAVEAQQAAARALPAAYLRDVFPRPGASLASGWRWVRLGEVATVVNGVGFPVHLQGHHDYPHPFIKVSDMNAVGSAMVVSYAKHTVNDTLLQEIGGRVYPIGTVIFPKVGGAVLTNKKRLLGVPSSFDNNVMGIVSSQDMVLSEWVYHWMLTVDLAALANIQALPSIRKSDIAALSIPLPPVPEQRRIVDRLAAQMAEVERAQAALDRTQALVDTVPPRLLQDALTGGF